MSVINVPNSNRMGGILSSLLSLGTAVIPGMPPFLGGVGKALLGNSGGNGGVLQSGDKATPKLTGSPTGMVAEGETPSMAQIPPAQTESKYNQLLVNSGIAPGGAPLETSQWGKLMYMYPQLFKGGM